MEVSQFPCLQESIVDLAVMVEVETIAVKIVVHPKQLSQVVRL